ncbi:MAG: hypothetical protein DCC73_02620 [Proteobacteria bacterium]|jgi:uncharacterized phage protein (TIGR02218 family)|nr:MAG: hypothetical protein DCC73_02620 [Pseudomonadota bacterium]
MRTIAAALASHLSAEVTTLAMCFAVRRRDGVRLGFTTADQALEIDGARYLPGAGLTPSDIAASRQMNVDEMEVVGVLSAHSISDNDLRAGLYDFAEVEIFLVNWASPSDGRVTLLRGWLGEATLKNGAFVAEVRGLAQSLQQTFGEVYSPECRADLGDARCRADLSAVTVTATVATAGTTRAFTATALGVADGWYDYGVLRWLTGVNAGRRIEVKRQLGNTLELYDAMPLAPAIGDVFSLAAGCDKRFATCKTKFANAANFRGEPHVPGIDSLLDYPGLR